MQVGTRTSKLSVAMCLRASVTLRLRRLEIHWTYAPPSSSRERLIILHKQEPMGDFPESHRARLVQTMFL